MIAKLGLGTAQFGLDYGISNKTGQVPSEEAATILAQARAAAIGLLDTAADYGNSEKVLSEILVEPSGFRIVTKTRRAATGLDAVKTALQQSMSRLGNKGLDTVLVHSADDVEALWPLLMRMKASGAIEKIGFSCYAKDEPAQLAKRFLPDVVQLPLSILDQRLLNDGTLSRLNDAGIEIHARSIFLQGLIFLDPDRLPPKLQSASNHLRGANTVVAAAGISMLEAALGFVLSRDEVSFAILGVTSRRELEEVVRAETHPVDAIEWADLALDDPVVLNPGHWN